MEEALSTSSHSSSDNNDNSQWANLTNIEAFSTISTAKQGLIIVPSWSPSRATSTASPWMIHQQRRHILCRQNLYFKMLRCIELWSCLFFVTFFIFYCKYWVKCVLIIFISVYFSWYVMWHDKILLTFNGGIRIGRIYFGDKPKYFWNHKRGWISL